MRAHTRAASRSPYALLCLASLFWAGNMVIGRGMRGDIPPVAMAFWRWTIAFGLILPFAWEQVWRQRREILRAWPVLAAMGIVGIGCFNTMCYIGLTMTTATNATLFNSIVPVFILPIAWVLIGERTTPAQVVGIVCSLFGVVVIVAHGDLRRIAAFSFNQGDVWLLAAMVLWALYTVLLRFRPAGLGMVPFLATILMFGWPLLLAWYLVEVAGGARLSLTPATAGAIAYFGVFPSVVAFVCYNRGVAAIGPTRAGVFVHLVPVFGILLSTVFLAEPPRSFHYAGMALIFTGIVLATRQRGRAAV
ncbi:MAG: EamA family transporter [Betaproteobacteria bacterium]|nr:EamA family transporter [Betaproteobacteria bacterium]